MTYQSDHERDIEDLAEAYQQHMGCGPGEFFHGYGVMCASHAHNHALYTHKCAFALDLAKIAVDSPVEVSSRLLGRLSDVLESTTSEGQGRVQEHWRGPDYVEGRDYGTEQAVEKIRELIQKPTKPEPWDQEKKIQFRKDWDARYQANKESHVQGDQQEGSEG